MNIEDRIERQAHSRGYYVNDGGELMSFSGKRMNPHTGTTGYRYFKMSKHGKRCSVHRLQAYQKFGDSLYDTGIVVRHLDGNPLNNRPENINIGTQSQNMMDRPQHIRMSHALLATSKARKYNREEVKAHFNGSYKKTMEYFGITSKGTLHFILNGSTPKQVISA